MIFSITNPSDHYTMDAESHLVAAVAVALLGGGQYGLRQCDGLGELVVPPFPCGGHEGYYMRCFGRTFADAVNFVDAHHLEELVAALGSVLVGDLDARREAMLSMRALPEAERSAWLLEFHDRRRSSANDIGRAAWQMSNMLADKLAARAATHH